MKDFRWKTMGRLANNLFQFAYLYSQVRDGKLPDIYLQDEQYFHKYKDEIKQLLSEGITYDSRVAIHVRRGDYVDNPFYVQLGENYYTQAMALFPGEQFVVCSDDIAWCKQQPMFKDCDFSEGTEEEDINLIASCAHRILSNSSFSWWGAYLSNHGTTIAPKQWFSDGVQRISIPKEWNLI